MDTSALRSPTAAVASAPAGVPEAITLERVQAVVAQHVLPYVRNHGGDIRITEVAADGAVTCRLDGACRSCPSAAITVVAVVERALQAQFGSAVRVHAPQIAVSAHAVERIRRFYPVRRVGIPGGGTP